MATRAQQTVWSYSEFARLPDDGNRYEVIAGELHVTPAPRPRHELASQRLNKLLLNFVDDHDLGWVLTAPVDVLFAEGDYMEPDIVVVLRGGEKIITDRGIEGPPDLIVEVVSGATAARDRGIKRERYAHFGVPLYWIMDGERRQMEVYPLQEDPQNPIIVRDTFTWTPVPDGLTLTISVPELFRGFE
jgi:Uma2 family endonuclease